MYYYYYIYVIQQHLVGCSATENNDVINANVSSQSRKSPIQPSETRVATLKRVASVRRMQFGMCRFVIAIKDCEQHTNLFTFIRGCIN